MRSASTEEARWEEPSEAWLDLAAIDQECGVDSQEAAELRRLVAAGIIERLNDKRPTYRWTTADGETVITMVHARPWPMRIWLRVRGQQKNNPFGHYENYTTERVMLGARRTEEMDE